MRCPCPMCIVFPICRQRQEKISCSILWSYLGNKCNLTDATLRYREGRIQSLFKKRIRIYDVNIKDGIRQLVLWWDTQEVK